MKKASFFKSSQAMKNKRKKRLVFFLTGQEINEKAKEKLLPGGKVKRYLDVERFLDRKGAIKSWEPKGTRDPMPRLPPRNKALLRDY